MPVKQTIKQARHHANKRVGSLSGQVCVGLALKPSWEGGGVLYSAVTAGASRPVCSRLALTCSFQGEFHSSQHSPAVYFLAVDSSLLWEPVFPSSEQPGLTRTYAFYTKYSARFRHAARQLSFVTQCIPAVSGTTQCLQ